MFSVISKLQLANTVWLVIVLQCIYCSILERDVEKRTRPVENCRGVSPEIRSNSMSVITLLRKLMNGPVAAASGNICMLRSKLTLISGIIITTVTTNLPYNTATDLYVILQ